jgi:hypothetical protein
MAHIARPSDLVVGGILASDLVEGTPIQRTNSGVINSFTSDLPIFAAAADNATDNVYVLMASPDDFSRPVDSRQYVANQNGRLLRTDGSFSDPIRTITIYDIGASNLYNPTLKSGWRAQGHKGTTVTVQNTAFTTSANIKVPGAKVKVTGGKWEYTSGANAVGEVDTYWAATDELTIIIWQ